MPITVGSSGVGHPHPMVARKSVISAALVCLAAALPGCSAGASSTAFSSTGSSSTGCVTGFVHWVARARLSSPHEGYGRLHRGGG